MPDSSVTFTEDAPQTSPSDWADAVAHHGLPLPAKKEQIALRVDADVIQWFRATGSGWQTRMNAVLKASPRHVTTKFSQHWQGESVKFKCSRCLHRWRVRMFEAQLLGA